MTFPRVFYPESRRDSTADVYHGVRVEDPYRWLEDPDSADTIAWTDAQNALTRTLLDGPLRERLRDELRRLYDYPRPSAPVPRGARYFFTFNTGLQNQPVLYVQDGLHGARRVLLDPNTLSGDGTIALTKWEPSPDGRYIAYALSRDGSDWQDIRVRDVTHGADLGDDLQWAKFVTIAWHADSAGFFYTRFPEHAAYHPAVYSHRLGAAQADDRLMFAASDDPEIVYEVDQSSDHRFLAVTAFKGASENSRVTVFAASKDAAYVRKAAEVGDGFENSWQFIEARDGAMFFRTNRNATRGCIVSVDAAGTMREIVPESDDSLIDATVVAHRLVALYLHNASSRVRIFELDGRPPSEVTLPSLGSVTEMTGEAEGNELFMRFASFVWPPTILRCDLPAKAGSYENTRSLRLQAEEWLPPRSFRLQPEVWLPPRSFRLQPEVWLPASAGSRNFNDYEINQTWYASRDGTRVSMFLVHCRDLPRDGARPVWLTAYGGFNINVVPDFDPAHFVWLDRGGVLAVPNLRGGGEYGEAWHQAGMLDRKQNVFDDGIAAAEHLIAEGYTRAGRIVLEGGSNGGLLVSAILTQRPDLPGAVICRVPVADMLRYHLFTVGRFWIPEYGCADDPAQFAFLYAYSPLHAVRDEVGYPPALITTAETDDRVDPGMARKLAARLQAACAASGSGPACIRIERRAGHGAGKPIAKLIEEDTDLYTFALTALEQFPAINTSHMTKSKMIE